MSFIRFFAATALLGLVSGNTVNKASTYSTKFSLINKANYESPKAATVQSVYTAVPNGEIWYDVDGDQIQAWGGNMLKEEDTYYWVGQDMTISVLGETPDPALVNMYSSTDLLNWKRIASPITVYTKDVNGNHLLTYCQVQRPKLLKSESTGKYIIWAHWEMSVSYAPSEIIVATADEIEGPYVLTVQGHRRPGRGVNDTNAMGDRVGYPVVDYNTAALNTDDTSHPLLPVQAGYPLQILQYEAQDPNDPQKITYVSQPDGYGTARAGDDEYELTNVRFNMTLKAIAVNMTAWDDSYYKEYVGKYAVSAADYIVRYPTNVRSKVAESVFTIGDPGNEREELVPPVIGPTLSESKSKTTVLVNSGDAAFITISSNNATIYYTTDGSTPSLSNSSQVYLSGTRITITGTANQNLTVQAIAVKDGKSSSVAKQTYQIAVTPSDVPIFTPIINFPSGTYEQDASAFDIMSMRVYCPTYGAGLYYTTDGLDPNPALYGDNIGYGARDMTVWEDPKTGDYYFITATDNVYNRVWKVNDDLTDVVPELEYDVFVDESREAPALVRNYGSDGEYIYLITSTQTGWFPNQAQYKRTDDISGGFTMPRDTTTGYRNGVSTWSSLQPVGDASTFYSQSTWVLNLGTDQSPSYVFIGDRYNTVDLQESTYVFMPLYINDSEAGESGVKGAGNMTLRYMPQTEIAVDQQEIVPPKWKLLSLNKPVTSTKATALTAAQQAAGTYNFSAAAANNGIDYDVSPYDAIENYFLPQEVPYFWQVDLEDTYTLSWIGLSFMSVGGSDAVNRYTLSGSVDNVTWTLLYNNSENLNPGFCANEVSGEFRYVKLTVTSVWDIDHSQEADWEAALYEASIYGQ